MQVRRVLPAVVIGAALVLLGGCGTTNPVSSTNGALDTTPPAAPQNLKAGLNAGELVLSWDASADADVAGYDVYRYAPDPSRENSYVKINSSLVTATSYEVSDATALDAYYLVKAVDRSSNVSSASADVVGAAAIEPAGNTDLPADPGMRHGSH